MPLSGRGEVGDQLGQRVGDAHVGGDVAARAAGGHRPRRRAPSVWIDGVSRGDVDAQVRVTFVDGFASQRSDIGIRESHAFIAPAADVRRNR
jgi:hypothetical protein